MALKPLGKIKSMMKKIENAKITYNLLNLSPEVGKKNSEFFI